MEFTIGTTVYRSGKLDAFRQLHIVRRLTPCLGSLADLASTKSVLKKDASGKVIDIEGDISQLLTPITNAITAMRDDDVEYVFNACLDVTERKQAGGKWAPIRVNGTVMFDGLTLPVLIQIAYHVIRENLTDFFSDLPQMSGMEGFLKAKGLLG